MKRTLTVSDTTPAAVVATKAKKKAKAATVSRRNLSFVNTGLGFPKKLHFTHRYVETGDFATGASGALATLSRNLNGMFNTGGAHQPYYFDQVAALYNTYCVKKCYVTVRFTSHTANSPSGGVYNIPYNSVGMYVNDDTTVVPNLNGLKEQANGRHTNLTQYDGTKVLKYTFDAVKWFGPGANGGADFVSQGGTNPTNIAVMTFYTDASLFGTAMGTYIEITFDYVAEWTDLKDIAQS